MQQPSISGPVVGPAGVQGPAQGYYMSDTSTPLGVPSASAASQSYYAVPGVAAPYGGASGVPVAGAPYGSYPGIPAAAGPQPSYSGVQGPGGPAVAYPAAVPGFSGFATAAPASSALLVQRCQQWALSVLVLAVIALILHALGLWFVSFLFVIGIVADILAIVGGSLLTCGCCRGEPRGRPGPGPLPGVLGVNITAAVLYVTMLVLVVYGAIAYGLACGTSCTAYHAVNTVNALVLAANVATTIGLAVMAGRAMQELHWDGGFVSKV